MKNRLIKKNVVLIMTLVILMTLVSPISFWAVGYDPINMDLNDPNDPTEDTCWLPDDVLYYDLYNMRPIIDTPGVVKYVYTDKSFHEDYLITDNFFYVGYRNEVTLYVKFVWLMYNGDTQSKYYFVVVHGPTFSEYMYMESLAGQSTHPILGNAGTKQDPYEETITVPNSKDKITSTDIKKTPNDGTGYQLIYPNSNYDIADIMDNVDLAVGENHVYIVILNTQGDMFKYYDITVVREPSSYTVTYYANDGTGDSIDVEVDVGEEHEVEENTFTPPTGYRFTGWNTEADGSGDSYAPGEEITINSDLELYAKWMPIVPSAPIVSMEKADSVLYLLWHNVGTGGVDSYKVKYYETADVTTAVERVIPLSALTINNSEISYHMFSGLKNDVEYTFEVQAVVTATGATSEETFTVGTPEYMGDPGGYSTDLVSIQGVSITPPIGGWPEEHGNTLIDPYIVSVTLPHDFSNIIIHRNFIQVADSATFIMYSDFGFTNVVESVNRLNNNWAANIYIRVTSANMQVVKFYRINIF